MWAIHKKPFWVTKFSNFVHANKGNANRKLAKGFVMHLQVLTKQSEVRRFVRKFVRMKSDLLAIALLKQSANKKITKLLTINNSVLLRIIKNKTQNKFY